MRTRYLVLVIMTVGGLFVIFCILAKIWASDLETIPPTVCENKFLAWLFSKSCLLQEVLPTSNDIVIAENGYPESWNKDGSELLISVEYTQTFVLRMKGMALQSVPDLIPRTDKIVRCLNWQDDQEPLIFLLGEANKSSIYRFNTETNELELLSDASLSCPSLSPDGQFIAFEDTLHRLVVMDRDGTNKQVMIEKSVSDPSWSPNGQQIAFVIDTDPDLTNYRGDIAVINNDGSGFIKLTNTPNIFESSPTWSPNSQYIAYLSRSETGSASYIRPPSIVYIHNRNEEVILQLTQPDYSYSNILWSPDGKWIAARRMLTRNNDKRINLLPHERESQIVLIPVTEDIINSSKP